MMTTKQYLLQIKYLENSIRRKRDQLDTIRSEMSMLKSPAYTSEKVQASKMDDKMLQLIILYSDIEARLTEEVSNLLVIREKIINQIEALDNDKHREVLYLVYVKHLSWDDVAQSMCYSRRRVEQIHGMALLEFEKRFRSISQ